MTRQIVTILGRALILTAAGAAVAPAQISTNPATIDFGQTEVGMEGTRTFTIINNGSSGDTVESFVFSSPQFGLANGLFPFLLGGHSSKEYAIGFKPALVQTYNDTLTINFQKGSPLMVPLNGAGVMNAGVTSVSATSLNFGSVPLGSTVTRNVTVTNTGTAPYQVTAITTYEPFTIIGFSSTVALNPGKSLTFQVAYSPTALGAVIGNVTISYNLHPSSGIDLSATGIAPAGLAVTSFPTLPAATQGYAYMANLAATGGTPPYTWQVTSGGVSGITFSSSGAFGGSVSSNVAVGNYPFTVQVEDSSAPPKRATGVVTLPVGAPNGANCSVISIDVAGTSNPVIALNDLGTGTYQGYEGGLYPDGSNVDPAGHRASAVSIAKAIQPLDANGNPDPKGVYVLLSLGVSNTEYSFIDFLNAAMADPQKNPHLVMVNGALEGETASALSNPSGASMTTILNYLLPFAGVTADQVAIAWVDAVDSTSASFPGNAETLQSELETIAQTLHTLFPNLVLAYFGSLNYTGYSQGVSDIAPEPQGYESAFGDKWAIQDQINGDPNLNFDPNLGPVKAPWMGWGSYYWANGLLARKDGAYWSCQDLNFDGTHPVYPSGQLKIVSSLFDFFKTDTSTTPWYF